MGQASGNEQMPKHRNVEQQREKRSRRMNGGEGWREAEKK